MRRIMNKIKYKKLEIKEEKEENIVAIDKTRLVEINEVYGYIQVRAGGKFFNKAIYLLRRYDWILGEDENGVLCLVPLKKRYE